MREAGVVISKAGVPIYWHVPANRSTAALPDSRNLWDVIWENREDLLGIAHSHPGGGVPGPSYEDVTTFAAIEGGLGRRLTWWITSSEAVVVVRWVGEDRLSYRPRLLPVEPSWVDELRQKSEGVGSLAV